MRFFEYFFRSWIYNTKGIGCKKTPCYIGVSACRWLVVKKAKIFEVMLNIFEFSRALENVEF